MRGSSPKLSLTEKLSMERSADIIAVELTILTEYITRMLAADLKVNVNESNVMS